jgi:hypothetical protein
MKPGQKRLLARIFANFIGTILAIAEADLQICGLTTV